MDRLFIIMPAYNEEAVIREVVDAWYAIVEEHHGDGDSRLVVINDGSTDRTQEILDDMQEARPLLHVINKANGGHGDALLTGYRCAVENHADYVFQTDSDGQTCPEEFEAFWRRREHFDLIIGNRKQRIELHAGEDGVDHSVFGAAGVDIHAVHRNPGARGIEVFILQLA